MSIEKKIDIIVDVSDAVTDVNKLDSSMKALDKTTQSLGSSQQATRQNVLDNGGAMGLLNDATGGLAMTFKDAVEASSLFGKQSKIGIATQKMFAFVMSKSVLAAKALKLALIATGIGALVVIVGSLIVGFDKVKATMENLIPGLKTVSEFIGNIIEAVTDFVGITSDATRALDKMVKASEKSLKENEHFLEANGDKYDEYTNRKIKANIDFNKKVVELNKQYEDGEIKSIEELNSKIKDFREKANREIADADADREEKRKEGRQKEIDEANAKAKQDAQLRQQERERIQKEAFDFAVKMAEMERTIQEEKRLRDAQIAEEDYQMMVEQFDREIALLKKKDEEDKKLKEQEQIRAQAVEDAKISVVQQSFALLTEIAGEGSKVGKALAVAQATINGYQAVQNAFATASASPVTTLFPAYPFIQAGLAGAFSALQIKKILATDPSKGGGNVSTGGGSGGGQAPTAPSFNLVGGTGINQIAQGLGQQSQPIQAYVVSGNVTSAQALDRNIVNTASVG